MRAFLYHLKNLKLQFQKALTTLNQRRKLLPGDTVFVASDVVTGTTAVQTKSGTVYFPITAWIGPIREVVSTVLAPPSLCVDDNQHLAEAAEILVLVVQLLDAYRLEADANSGRGDGHFLKISPDKHKSTYKLQVYFPSPLSILYASHH